MKNYFFHLLTLTDSRQHVIVVDLITILQYMHMFAFKLYQAALKKVCVLAQVEEGAKKIKKIICVIVKPCQCMMVIWGVLQGNVSRSLTYFIPLAMYL